MKNFSKLLLTLLAISFTVPVLAQQERSPCGTQMGISPWLKDFQRRIHEASRNDEVLYLPLQVHVVGTDNGAGYFSRKGVLDAFCTLNEDFEQANIQFFLPNPINYIDNSDYYDHNFEQGYDMMSENNYPSIINCYIVDSPAGNCGYFFPGVDGIALARGCVQPNDHTWAHEVGHYLSLPHPFSGWEGVEGHDYDMPAPESWGNDAVEKLDGSNCAFAGDGFCDTAPDYLNYRWSCNSSSTSNVQQTDPNGETFVSDGSLFMSYSNPSCKSTFSPDQIAAMRANVEEVRSYLISDPPVLEDIPVADVDEVSVIYPTSDDLVETSTVTIEWEAVPNATHYVLQINPFNIFSIIFEEMLVEGTSATVSDLRPDETYYWRVRPFNPYETCTNFTSSNSFSTGNVVSTNELREDEFIEVYPNPVVSEVLNLNMKVRNTQEASWRLVNGAGAVLQQSQLSLSNTQQQFVIPVAQLPAGMYLLQLILDDRQIMRKVVIQ